MAITELPASHADLLERPTFAHLATVAPDGSPHTSVMWFVWDGEVLRFTHTSTRQKHKKIPHEPRVATPTAPPAPDRPPRHPVPLGGGPRPRREGRARRRGGELLPVAAEALRREL